MAWPPLTCTPLTRSAAAIKQSTQVIEPIGCNYSSRNQFPESVLYFRWEVLCSLDQVGEEARAVLPQITTEVLSDRAEREFPLSIHAEEPRHVLSREQTDGSNAGRDDPSWMGGVAVVL